MPKSNPRPYQFYTDPLNRRRYRWFVLARAQAEHRGEQWNLTYEDFSEFWPTEAVMAQRGRRGTSLCLTRYDTSQPWDRSNTCQLTRYNCLYIKNRRQWDLPCDEFFQGARFL